MQRELFLEDYRHKELCRKRQKNMDSAFEGVYHSVRQDPYSQLSSVAGKEEIQWNFNETKENCHQWPDVPRQLIAGCWKTGRWILIVHNCLCPFLNTDIYHIYVHIHCTFYSKFHCEKRTLLWMQILFMTYWTYDPCSVHLIWYMSINKVAGIERLTVKYCNENVKEYWKKNI